jgi:hypothetical protein
MDPLEVGIRTAALMPGIGRVAQALKPGGKRPGRHRPRFQGQAIDRYRPENHKTLSGVDTKGGY